MIEHRSADLAAYQNPAYAQRYRSLVEKVRQAEQTRAGGRQGLAEAVARYAYKLMAYKDEYEVGRLYSHPDFLGKLNERFEGGFKLRFNLAPPMIAPKDKVTGLPRKMEFGGWMLPLMRGLARLRFLRGTPFDPFGWSEERKTERQLIADYENVVAELLDGLNDDNHGLAVSIASVPDQIRGFGHIKLASVKAARACEADLLEAWRTRPQDEMAA